MRKRIVIIGGGVSGLTAVINRTRNGTHAIIVEHMDRTRKKILPTSNGRCDLINLRMEADCYRCGRKEFSMKVIRGFGMGETLAFFRGLGIESKDRNGYIYPSLDQTSAVLNVPHSGVERLGVAVLLSCHVEKIEPAAGDGHVCYKMYTGRGVLDVGAVVLAANSKTAPSTGSDGSGYELAGRLRHRVIKPFPALMQLRCQGNLYRQMVGIRMEVGVKLMAVGEPLARGRGELQLTNYGLPGVPISQISRFAAGALDQGKRVVALVDFMPFWDDSEAFGLLKERTSLLDHKTMEGLLTDLLNKKLAPVPIKLAGIELSRKSGSLSPKQLKLLLGQMRSYETIVISVNPFASAQVCCGGVDTGEVDAAIVEPRLHANLYLAGKLLDVDGICGGYNLQFTWSSDMVAGTHAAGGHPAGKHEAGANKAAVHGAYTLAPDRKRNRK